MGERAADLPPAPPTPKVRSAAMERLRTVGPALLVALAFGIGAVVLHRMLGSVDLGAVVAEIRAVPPGTVALACLTTGLSYAALIGYDWAALRHIGRDVPPQGIALGGFSAFAVGNTVGLSALSGNAIRYRVYSGYGLTLTDVAAVGAFTMLAFGLGLGVVGLAALIVDPAAGGAGLGLSPGIVRGGSMAVLALSGLVVGWLSVRGTALKIGRYTLRMPALPVLGGQIAIAMVDLLLAGATLYILLGAYDLPVAGFLVVFVVAVVVGIASHVPGGVGVFETVMLVGLSGKIPAAELAAALFLYRIVYYWGPFALALVLLTAGEATRARRWLGPMVSVSRGMVPKAMAAMTALSGIVLLLSTVIPFDRGALRRLEKLMPLEVIEAGALLASALGALLILVAHGLARRNRGAYWIALMAMLAGSVAALTHGLDWDRAVVSAGSALVLWSCRREFTRTARLVQEPLSAGWLALMALVAIASLFLLLFAHKSQPYSSELWWQFAFNAEAPRSMRAAVVASLVMGIGALAFALRSARGHTSEPDAEALDRVAPLVAAQSDPEANLVFAADKSVMVGEGGDAFVMYGVQGRSWIALGAPYGPADAVEALAWRFRDAARAANARAVFYQVDTDSLPVFLDMGMALHKLGEEAVVPLAGFGLEGSARKSLRTVYNRARRDGLSLEMTAPPHDPALIGTLRAVSDEWLAHKGAREKRFSVGRFDPAYLDRFPLAVIRAGDRVVAFANVMTTEGRTRAAIDLMRHVEDGPQGVMDFLFTELMLTLKAEGYAEFSLGMAPLSGMADRRGAPLWNRIGAAVARHGGQFYGFEGLRRFKNKFGPEWHPRYLACDSHLPPLVPLADATILIAGGARGVIGK